MDFIGLRFEDMRIDIMRYLGNWVSNINIKHTHVYNLNSFGHGAVSYSVTIFTLGTMFWFGFEHQTGDVQFVLDFVD